MILRTLLCRHLVDRLVQLSPHEIVPVLRDSISDAARSRVPDLKGFATPDLISHCWLKFPAGGGAASVVPFRIRHVALGKGGHGGQPLHGEGRRSGRRAGDERAHTRQPRLTARRKHPQRRQQCAHFHCMIDEFSVVSEVEARLTLISYPIEDHLQTVNKFVPSVVPAKAPRAGHFGPDKKDTRQEETDIETSRQICRLLYRRDYRQRKAVLKGIGTLVRNVLN